MRGASIMAFVGFLVILAPFGAAAAVIAEQPVFTDTEHITGDTPLIFSGASGRTPSLLSLLSATGTVKTAKIRYNMPSWPGANGLYAYLYECPLHVGDTLPQCRRIVSHDASLGWDGSLLHPPVANNGELTIGFNDAQAEGFGDEVFTSGVPLNPARGYRLEAVFTPNTFNVDISGTFGTTSAGGFYPYFKLEGDGPVEATTTPDKPDPVIIVPGILGSQEHNGVWIMDPILHSYDDLIATLDANGYTPEVDLFTFPYDWRNSNVDTAVRLKTKIDEVKAICQCAKIDLVTHSMGGLVARQYIQSSAYEHDVDQIIFIGTPHLGAPKAYLMWEGGKFGTALDPIAFILEGILSQQAHENGYNNLFEYVQNDPINAVRELLPTYSYIFDGPNLRTYPTQYPTNSFLENLNGNSIDPNIKVTNIIGDIGADTTISGIDVTLSDMLPMWEHGYPVDFSKLTGSHGLQLGAGDGTVPFASARGITAQNVTTLNSCHLSLPSFAANKVVETLTEISPVTQTVGTDICNAKIMIIKVLSPVDLLVVAPDGKKEGKDFLTGGELHEMSRAFYSGSNTKAEFVAILNPQKGQYKVYTQGVSDGGPYSIEVSNLDSSTTTFAIYSGTTSVDVVTEHLVDVDSDVVNIAPLDLVSPSAVFSQPVTSTFTHSSVLPIKVAFSDNIGVATSSVSFDTRYIPASTTIDLYFQSLGGHTIFAMAKDFAGNGTTTVLEIQVIATVASTKSDVLRAYSLGWLKRDFRDLLVFQLNQSLVLQKISTIAKDGSKVVTTIQVLDKALLQLVAKELEAAKRTGAINTQGYEVLSKDIYWLLSHN